MPNFSAVSTVIKTNQFTVTSTAAIVVPAGTNEATAEKGIAIKNCSHLAGQTPINFYVGDSGVTVSNGFPLGPGDSVNTQSLAAVWAVSNTGETCMGAYFADKA